MSVTSPVSSPGAFVWLGTYPSEGLGSPAGKGEGLWQLHLGAGGQLGALQVNQVPAPSFVATHPEQPWVYAVSETAPSELCVFDPKAPHEPVARVILADTDSACHVSLSPDASALYVSHYGSGQISVVQLDHAGLPLAEAPHQTFTYEGHGPVADRQGSAHAHFAALSPGGSHLLVSDLGSDTLWAHQILPHGLLGEATVGAALPPGSGPRHFAVRGNLLYVACELDQHVRVLRWDRASASALVLEEHPSTLVADRSGLGSYDAHVIVVAGPWGDALLVSVRGADVISIFDIMPEGQLTYRAAVDSGHWPRHFAVVAGPDDEDYVVVAAERGHEVRALSLRSVMSVPPEMERGAVASVPYTSIGVTSPACICPPGMPA